MRDKGTLRTRSAKGIFWTASSNWIDQLTRVVIFVILSRLLEPEAFGLVALALVFVGFTEAIANQGLVEALVQRKHLDSTHFDTAFWIAMGSGTLLSVFLIGLAVPVANLLDQESLVLVLVVLSLVIPIGSASIVQRAILTRNMAFRSLAVRTLVSISVGSVMGVGAAFMGFGVWSLVAQRLSTQLTGTIVLWRVSTWRPRLTFSYTRFRELVRFGKHVVGTRLLNYFNANADNLVIGSVLGPTSLGFYTVGYRILRLTIQMTSNIIDKVAFPVYSRLQDNPKRFRRVYYKSTSFTALIAFPAFIGILILAPEIVTVVFGSKWLKSAPVMQVLALFGIVRAVTYLNSSALVALGKPSWRVVIVGITAVLNTVAFLIAVKHGIVAVAVAVLCVGYFVAPISYWAVRRLVSIDARTYFRHIREPLLASVFLASVMLGVRHLLNDVGPVLTLLLVSVAGLLSYFAALHFFARPLANEARQFARRALPNPRLPRLAKIFSRR